jgi:hypothetical protein
MVASWPKLQCVKVAVRPDDSRNARSSSTASVRLGLSATTADAAMRNLMVAGRFGWYPVFGARHHA